jgi:tetratricopeptide (TPR) repeat protein
LFAVSLFASEESIRRAEELYLRTEYQESLSILLGEKEPGSRTVCLAGQDYLMLGDYKRAIDSFEKAFAEDPGNATYALWLGRAWGRKAEASNPFYAAALARKARQYFELSVALDPTLEEALADLFDYYLEAPGFLGGGLDRAEALAVRLRELDPAAYQFSQGRIAEKRKEYDTAEEHFRRAMGLAPRQVGHILDLAKYLAKHGRYDESEAAFQQAERIAPDSPRVMFAHAHSYIQEKRNLDAARELLKKYLESSLTPDDPPKEEAQRLLKQAGA